MISGLIKLANHLDKSGYEKEANFLDHMIKKISEEEPQRLQQTRRPMEIKNILNSELYELRRMSDRGPEPGPTPDGKYTGTGFGLGNDVAEIAMSWNEQNKNQTVSFHLEGAVTKDGAKARNVVWTVSDAQTV